MSYIECVVDDAVVQFSYMAVYRESDNACDFTITEFAEAKECENTTSETTYEFTFDGWTTFKGHQLIHSVKELSEFLNVGNSKSMQLIIEPHKGRDIKPYISITLKMEIDGVVDTIEFIAEYKSNTHVYNNFADYEVDFVY
jgi:hypothetical protein